MRGGQSPAPVSRSPVRPRLRVSCLSERSQGCPQVCRLTGTWRRVGAGPLSGGCPRRWQRSVLGWSTKTPFWAVRLQLGRRAEPPFPPLQGETERVAKCVRVKGLKQPQTRRPCSASERRHGWHHPLGPDHRSLRFSCLFFLLKFMFIY